MPNPIIGRSTTLALALVAGCAGSSVCGYGFEQRGNSCFPICVEECGEHAKCNVTATRAKCECVAGYTGDPCEWTGALLDPDFSGEGVWSRSNGADVSKQTEGLASFPTEVACNAGAVWQVVEMPSYEDAEPLAIELTYRMQSVSAIEVGYGRAFRELRPRQVGWNTDRICLGAEGYDGPVKFQVAASEQQAACFSAPVGEIEVDRFEIVVADEGECPAPGTLINGEANVDDGGWFFDLDDPIGVGATTAALEEGVGRSGSSGARLHKPPGSTKLAGMYTQLSVPLPTELPSPAMRFWWQGNGEWLYDVYLYLGSHPGTRIEGRPLDVFFEGGSPGTATYCLPPWTHGNVVDLSFVLRGGSPDAEAEFVVDDVEFFSDPRCGDSPDLLDPSFDSAPIRWPGVAQAEPFTSVAVLDNPGLAHPPGSGVLELRYARNDVFVEAQTWVWVPLSEGDRGPQLLFYSNVPANPGMLAFWALGSVASVDFECVEEFCPLSPLSNRLVTGGGWQPNRLCLPPEWGERWYRVRIVVRPTEEPLELFDPSRAVFVDDFSVGLDERCPAFNP